MTDKKVVMFYPYVAEGAAPAVEKVIKSRWIGQGHLVAEFEALFRKKTGAPYAAAVTHVSSAIRLALAISGVGPGDEVITTPQTCTATNHPILEQFAVPVFADIEHLSGNIDPYTIERRITPKTKAILCAHWGGYPCELDHISAIAEAHNLKVIEDASDALGAAYKGRAVGTISPFTCFCFQAIQQVTAGEGGMLAATEEKTFLAALRRRWFGIDRVNRIPNSAGYYDFDVWETGYGYHLTNIAAAIGLANLREMEAILERRREIACKYRQELAVTDGVTLFRDKPDRDSAWQLFTIHVPRRDDFCRALRSRGVETSIVHNRNDVYSVFGGRRDDLPVLDAFAETFICIPLHNQMTDAQVDHVIAAVRKGW
jgi:perosamine synthetase